MEVREPSAKYLAQPGYKQTEVGVIPEDWECTSVSQLVRDGMLEKPLDGNHGNIHPKSGDFVSFGIPFVMANNVRGGRIDLGNCAFIRKEQADSLQKGFSRPGDVLLTHKATIGNTAVVGEIPFEYIMLTPQVTYYRVADRTRLSNLYLRQFFDSSSFQAVLLAKSGGGTRAYIGITAQLQLPVVLPPTKVEQEAIAEALSDADALIESLEQLLAKKRQLKQGAMQELFTGKKRLPGFSGEWEMKQLGDVVEIHKGELITEKNAAPGAIPVIAGGKKPAYFHDCANRSGKTITISGSGANAGYVAFYSTPLFASDCSTIGEGSNYSVEFIYFALLLNQDSIYKAQTGGAQPHIHPSDLRPLLVSVPETKDEQTAIAGSFFDMDAEMAALEAKLTKARQLKQGMMQELLTGRIRLI